MTTMSFHSKLRAAQRCLGEDEVDYILRFGTHFFTGGAEIYYLRDKDIPDTDRRANGCMRLGGTAVVLSRDRETVITIWRNRKKGLKRIRKKPGYSTQVWWAKTADSEWGEYPESGSMI